MYQKIMQKSVLASAVAAIVCPLSVVAAEATEGGLLEETVVTASRMRQRIMDSAASLSVITEADLARSTGYSLAELLRDIPSVQVTDAGQPGLGRIRIRGEESRRSAILINGQEVTDHFEVGTPLTLHPSMVERIEVLRGSGGVLYGSRALSGVVNFITRKGGTEPLQATFSAGYDSGTSGYNTFASLYGNADGLEYRLAWSQSDHEERSTPEGDIDNTSFDNENSYLFLGRGFGDHRFEYIYEDYESSSDIFVEEAVRTSFPFTDFFLETPQRDREKHALAYYWEADSNWLHKLSASAYHQDSDREFHTIAETVWYERDVLSISDLKTEGALLQLDLQPLAAHRLIAGLQYLSDEVAQERVVDTVAWAPQAVTGVEQINDTADIETWAWFVQDQWQVSDDVALTGGLRQYFVQGELKDSNRDGLSADDFDDDRELIAALGVVWSLQDDLHLRLNIAQGYVYPSLSQLATGAFAGASYINPDGELKPETSVNYDLGLRMQRGGLMLDATAFYTESEDYIDHLPCTLEDACPGARDRVYLNIGESMAYGVEIAISHSSAFDAVEPYATITWMKRRNEFDAFATWDSGVPELSGRLGIRWQDSGLLLQGLWSDVFLRGETGSDLREPGTSRDVIDDKSGWLTVNAALGLNFGTDQQYQLTTEFANLTDKKYIGSTENLYGVERSVAMKLSMNW